MPTSPERRRLAQAIEDTTNAQRLLDEARAARQNAQAKWSDANSRIGEINVEIEAAEEHAEGSTDDVIASLAGGGDVLDKPRTRIDELRAQLGNAERESAKWRHAIDLSEQAAEARQHALDMAEHFVDGAARKVVAVEVNVAAMLCVCEGLRSELLNSQAKLAAVAGSMEHGAEQRRTIDNFVNDVGWLVDASWRDRPAAQPIKDAFAALKVDASAPLKAH